MIVCGKQLTRIHFFVTEMSTGVTRRKRKKKKKEKGFLVVDMMPFLYSEGWKVTLLESMNKRCVFLEHAISATGLSNVQVVRGRAEVLPSYCAFPLRCDSRFCYTSIYARAYA